MIREDMLTMIITAIQDDATLLKAIRLSATRNINMMVDEQLAAIISTLHLGE